MPSIIRISTGPGTGRRPSAVTNPAAPLNLSIWLPDSPAGRPPGVRRNAAYDFHLAPDHERLRSEGNSDMDHDEDSALSQEIHILEARIAHDLDFGDILDRPGYYYFYIL